MKFRVTYADGSQVEGIPVIPSARRAVEAEFGKQLVEVMASGFSDWTDLVVWTFLKIRCGEVRSLDDWLATVDSIEMNLDAPKEPTSESDRNTSDSSEPPSEQDKTSTT